MLVRRSIVFATVLLLLVSPQYRGVRAEESLWDDPINLSNSPRSSSTPSIAVDTSGTPHVVWCEALGDFGCDAIFYTRREGGVWLDPIDIFFAPEFSGITDDPKLSADADGWLHLVWSGGYRDKLMYSRAYAPTASSARGWTKPLEIVGQTPQLVGHDLSLGSKGEIHVAYTVRLGEDSGIYHIYSTDNGETWQTSSDVYTNLRSDRMLAGTSLAIDMDGGIHIAWTEFNYPDTFPPLGIRYARSEDGGNSWSQQLSMDGPYGNPRIVANGTDIHLVWSGTAPDRRKLHRWSDDRGLTWSVIGSNLDAGGFQGPPGLAVDGGGNVHLLQIGGGPEALYHHAWTGAEWAPPFRISTIERIAEAPIEPFGADIAIGLGNVLHVATTQMVKLLAESDVGDQQNRPPDISQPGDAQNVWVYDVFYVRGLAEAPAIEPVVLTVPATDETDDAVAEVQTIDILESEARPLPVQAISGPQAHRDTPQSYALLIGLIPVAILLLGAIMGQFVISRDK